MEAIDQIDNGGEQLVSVSGRGRGNLSALAHVTSSIDNANGKLCAANVDSKYGTFVVGARQWFEQLKRHDPAQYWHHKDSPE